MITPPTDDNVPLVRVAVIPRKVSEPVNSIDQFDEPLNVMNPLREFSLKLTLTLPLKVKGVSAFASKVPVTWPVTKKPEKLVSSSPVKVPVRWP